MSERVLVTGATGTVGATVLPALEDEVQVRAATRSPDDPAIPDAVEPVDFSFARPETWGAALAAVDRLFLLWPPETAVSAVQSFVDAAARSGVEHVTYLSVLGADKVPLLPHRRIERHLRAAPLTGTVLRAAYFAQNLAEMHRPEIVERDEIFVPAGNGELGIVDARDVGAVAARTLLEPQAHRGQAYTLTGPTALSFRRVAAIATAVLDRPIRYADPSALQFARRMYRRGVSAGLIGFMLAEYTVARLGLAARTTGTVERLLGRPPRSVRAFFEDYQDRFRRETAPESQP